jgi:hypothetical protein
MLRAARDTGQPKRTELDALDVMKTGPPANLGENARNHPSTLTRVVYTAVFGNYDQVAKVDPGCGCDFVCFTDSTTLVAPGWRKVVVDTAGDSPALSNRRYKMLPHRFLAQYVESLYVDGHVVVRRCPVPLFEKYLGQVAIALPVHQDRRCAYEEADYCVRDGLVDDAVVQRQLAEYEAQGFPREYGMTENGVILRRHCDPLVIRLMEQWWNEYCTKVRRDQISLPFLLWRNGVKAGEIEEGPRLSGRYFRLKPHAHRRQHWVKTLVWYVITNRHRNTGYAIAFRAYRLMTASLAPTKVGKSDWES